jgi:hypothetical protein
VFCFRSVSSPSFPSVHSLRRCLTHSTHSLARLTQLIHWLPVFYVAASGHRTLPRGGCAPWRPSGSASFEWQPFHTMVSAFFGSVGECFVQRDRMFTLVSLGLRRAAFAQQAWNNAHCFIKGSGVRPGVRRGPGLLQESKRSNACSGVPRGSKEWNVWNALPRRRMFALFLLALSLFRGKRRTLSIAKGSGACPRVPRAPPFCLATVGQHAFSRARTHAWCLSGSAAFARQAWGNVHDSGIFKETFSLTHSLSFVLTEW